MVTDANNLMTSIQIRLTNQRLLIFTILCLTCLFVIINYTTKNNNNIYQISDNDDLYIKKHFNKIINARTQFNDDDKVDDDADDVNNNGINNDNNKNEINDDDHMKMLNDIKLNDKRTFYPKRKNMGDCPKTFGKVTVFVAVVESSYKTHYHVAQQTLECYLKSVNYTFALVDLDKDPKVNKYCKHDQLFFKKHCAASVYLEETDWMLVLDADAGVVNPNHCIEEYIDDRVDIIFYERFFNWEIASGNYIVKNTEFARNFLRKWADWQYIQPSNWNGADNGVLQIHILQTVMPGAKAEIKACDSIWHKGKDYDTYMNYVTCVKVTLGATRLWPGKIRIYRRAHGWVRDGYLTTDGWSENDFMLHGWKLQEIEKNGWSSPFSKMFNISECGRHYAGWNWRSNKRLAVEEVKRQLSNFEHGAGRNFPKQARELPYLVEPDIGECYPNCDERT